MQDQRLSDDELMGLLSRMGRETRTVRHPAPAAGWAGVQARLVARSAPARRAWGALAVTLALVVALALPLLLVAPVPGHGRAASLQPVPYATPLAPVSAALAYTQAPARTATDTGTPPNTAGEITGLNHYTVPPEPVPQAPGRVAP